MFDILCSNNGLLISRQRQFSLMQCWMLKNNSNGIVMQRGRWWWDRPYVFIDSIKKGFRGQRLSGFENIYIYFLSEAIHCKYIILFSWLNFVHILWPINMWPNSLKRSQKCTSEKSNLSFTISETSTVPLSMVFTPLLDNTIQPHNSFHMYTDDISVYPISLVALPYTDISSN